MKSLVILSFLFFFKVASATLLRPTSLDSTSVLPKNIRNLSVRFIDMPTYDRFNNTGLGVGTGDALNKQVSYDDFIDGLDDFNDQEFLKEDLNQKGISNLNEIAGQVTGDVNVEAFATVPIFAIGVSKKLTLAVAVPILRVSLKTDVGFVATDSFQTYANSLLQTKSEKYDEAKRKTDTVIKRKLEDNGYTDLSDIRNIEKSGIGDARLVAKYQLSKKDGFELTMTNALTLPTGEERDVNRLIDVPLGDGQFDYELGFATSYRLTDTLMGFFGTSYNVQFEDTSAERIPEKDDSRLTPDVDSSVERDLGDILKTEISLAYLLSDEITLSAGHIFQHKQRDSYKGNLYEGYRYDWLADETEQALSSFIVAGELSTINLYRTGDFKVPGKLKLTHVMSLDGKNVAKDNLTTLEVALYF